jgi:hypothetical protein
MNVYVSALYYNPVIQEHIKFIIVSVYFNTIQFISLSIDPLQGQIRLGYRNSQDYNQLGPITNY